jgi:hypothetical protein
MTDRLKRGAATRSSWSIERRKRDTGRDAATAATKGGAMELF